MAAEKDKLHDTLRELHDELQSPEKLDPELVGQLRSVLDDIHAALNRQERESDESDGEGSEKPEPPSFSEALEDAQREFAVTHPTVARTIGRLIDVLAQAGI